MNPSQKKVAVGALSGIVTMAVFVYALYSVLGDVTGVATLPERLAFTLRMNVVAVIPLFIMLIAVGNGRFLSDAIDPTKHLETKSIEINGRVADNTFQQNFVFLVGTLALSTFLTESSMKLIPALVAVFILARIVFWVGYLIEPLYRAPGMAATSYMNLGILLAVLYLLTV